MSEFMSLKEFLLLAEMPGLDNREYYVSDYGFNWVERYNIAKSSFLRFGEEGPPINSKIECLRGSAGYSIFKGICPQDERFFAIARSIEDNNFGMIYRKIWWREFCVYESFKELLPKVLETISMDDLLKAFPDFFTKELLERYLNGSANFLHPYRERPIKNWLREKGILC